MDAKAVSFPRVILGDGCSTQTNSSFSLSRGKEVSVSCTDVYRHDGMRWVTWGKRKGKRKNEMRVGSCPCPTHDPISINKRGIPTFDPFYLFSRGSLFFFNIFLFYSFIWGRMWAGHESNYDKYLFLLSFFHFFLLCCELGFSSEPWPPWKLVLMILHI